MSRQSARAYLKARLTVLLGIALLAACSSNSNPRESAHVLRIADASDPESLNPLLAHDQDTIGWDLLYCETLVGLDRNNKPIPILIDRIPSRANGGISSDGRTITYKLRNIRFADGKPLTSADVAFTYHAILDPRNNVLSQDEYRRRIARLSTPDGRTVVIRLREPWNAATSVLFSEADFAFGVLPAHAFSSTNVERADWAQHPFGTGPFRVVEWRRGDRIVLEPNPYYFPKPKLARVELRMIPTTESTFVALQAHEVDVGELTPDELQQARSERGLRVVRTRENSTYWLTLQTQVIPTNDVRVRRAIADAIDVNEITKTYADIFEPAGSFIPPVLTRWHNPSPPRERNADQAAKELHAAGWQMRDGVWTKAGRQLEGVLVLTGGRADDSRTATMLQERLTQAGMRFAIKTFPPALFNAVDGPLRSGRFTMALDGYLGGSDPEQSVVFACSQIGLNGGNDSRFCDPEFDGLLADQRATPSDEKRRRDFDRMQAIVRESVPIVPLYYGAYVEAQSVRVSGFARNMLDYPVDPAGWDAN